MRLLQLRSAWGISGLRADAPRALAVVARAGWDGLEASLDDIGADSRERRAFCRAARAEGVPLILSAYSSWPNYEGPADAGRPVAEHVESMLRSLESIAELNAAERGCLRVNAHSGTDAWSEDEARHFFEAVGEGSRVFGGALPAVSHETHRGRYLCCAFATARLLAELPSLRLTCDFSHWAVKHERLLDEPTEAELLRERIAPAVDHIHARLGTAQAPQLADPDDPKHRRAAERFYAFWEQCWSAQAEAAREAGAAEPVLTATMEYGPAEWSGADEYAGYTPVDLSGRPVARRELDATLTVARDALRRRFERWQASEAR